MTPLRSRLFGDFYSFFLTSLLRQQWPRTALRPSSSWCRQERNNPLEIPAKLPCFRPQKPHRMYLAVKNDAIACFYAVGKTPAPDSLVKPCQVLWWQPQSRLTVHNINSRKNHVLPSSQHWPGAAVDGSIPRSWSPGIARSLLSTQT